MEGRSGRCAAMEREGAEPWKAWFRAVRFLSFAKDANRPKAAQKIHSLELSVMSQFFNGNLVSSESYFSFNLKDEIFSLPVRYVKEVFEFESITPIPNSLPYLKGVMNVRGGVVSIVDLRRLFGFEVSDDLTGTQVIIMEIPRQNEKSVLLGIIADKVDVVSYLNLIQADSKNYGINEGQDFVSAVARRGEDFILILNPEKILNFIEEEVEKASDLQTFGRSV